MAQQTIKESNDKELHWFWRLTTKWWFFPVFYTSIALLFTLMNAHEAHISVFFITLLALPSGIYMIFYRILHVILPVNLLSYFDIEGGKPFYAFTLILHILFITSVISIIYKSKKGKILKWLIITLIFLIIISFIGCSLGIKQL